MDFFTFLKNSKPGNYYIVTFPGDLSKTVGKKSGDTYSFDKYNCNVRVLLKILTLLGATCL